MKILLVEDDLGHASLIRAALDEAVTDMAVRHVPDLRSAVDAIEWPDCVLLDLGLPDADGLEAIDRLTGVARDASLVVLTGRSDRDLGVQATAHGAHDYLLKDSLDAGVLERSVLQAIERRRMQRELERSEERYRSLVHIAPAGILTVDREGRVSFANERLCTIVGLTESEVVGAVPADLVDPRHRRRFQEAAERLASGLPGNYDLEVHRRDGSTRWVHITSRPFADDEGEFSGALVVATDITARKRATERLGFQAAVLEAVGEAVIVTEPDGTILFWNAAAERLYGWSEAEVLGRNAVEVTPSEASQAEAREIMAALQRGETWSGEFEVRRRDGTAFPALVSDSPMLDENGELVGIIGVSIDLTHRVQARRALEARAAQQSAVATVAALALSDTTLSSLLHTATAQAALALDADIAEVLMITEEGDLRLEACHGIDPHLVASTRVPRGVPSFAGRAIERDQGIMISDIEPDGDLAPFLRDRGIVAGAGVVIRVDGEPWGALCVFDCVERDRARDDLTVLQSIADLVANSMHRLSVLRELDRRAVTDDLTGLPNRAAFLDRLDHALNRRQRDARGLAVLFADLDRFKDVNDALGHAVGDDLIRAVGQVMADAVRAGDTVARFGGDEFAVLCDPVDGAEQAIAIADRITRTVGGTTFVVDRRELSTSISVGVALSGPQADSAEEMLRDADAAMYRAKAAGGGLVDLFDEGLQRQLVERLDLAESLRRGIGRGELELCFQPEVALDGSGVVWVEALVRWRHPELGVLAPERFIDLAEETGLIRQLGSWVIDAAVGQLTDWQRGPGPAPSSMSVNLSAIQLLEPDLVERTDAVLRRHGQDPSSLWFELTETSLLREPERSLAVLHSLHELGTGLAIDDFGTGYASLAWAQQLPVDALKIDRSFVSGLLANRRDEGIVRAVIEMARSFGILSIAEGVQDQDQLDELRRLGCDYAQGYLLARPMPADEVPAWINAWRVAQGGTAAAEEVE